MSPPRPELLRRAYLLINGKRVDLPMGTIQLDKPIDLAKPDIRDAQRLVFSMTTKQVEPR